MLTMFDPTLLSASVGSVGNYRALRQVCMLLVYFTHMVGQKILKKNFFCFVWRKKLTDMLCNWQTSVRNGA